MSTDEDLRELHRRALASASTVIADVQPADLTKGTPCAGWPLRALLAHMIGQNRGFATAIANGDAQEIDYAVSPPGHVYAEWRASVGKLTTACDAADDGRKIRLVEIDPQARLPLSTVLGIHLLDTVVHTWDVTTALGLEHRPDEETVQAVLHRARRVPAGESRTAQDAQFAPPVTGHPDDPWAEALALLGRSVHGGQSR